MERTELELYITSKYFSNREILDDLIRELEQLFEIAKQKKDDDAILYYADLIKETQEKKEEHIKIFG